MMLAFNVSRLSAVAPETLLPIALGRAIAENQCYIPFFERLKPNDYDYKKYK